MKVLILCLVASFSSVFAENLLCPNKSIGQYPKCQCLNGAKYDATYNWCTSDLKELLGKCPIDGPGIFPNCNCGVGKLFDKFSNICIAVNRNVCPDGATGTMPNCQCPQRYVFDEVHHYCRPWYLSTTRAPTTRTYKPPPFVPRCGAFQYGTYPDCHWRPCPSYALNPNGFEPHCRYNHTYIDYKPCPDGFVGSPPYCYKKCPPHHYGRYPNCQRVKCQTGRGWSGKYAPDCKFTPTCPPEFPGIWPACDIYLQPRTQPNIYLPPTTTTQRARTLPNTYLPPLTTPKTTTTTRKPTTIVNTYLPPVTTTTQRARTFPNTYLPPHTTIRPIFFRTLPPFKYTYLPPNK